MHSTKQSKHINGIFLQILTAILTLILSISPVYAQEKIGEKDNSGYGIAAPEITVLPDGIEVINDNAESQSAENQAPKEKPAEMNELLPDSLVSIEEAVSLALRNNLQIKARRENINKSISQYDQAKSYLNVKSRLEGRVQAQGPARTLGELIPMPIPEGMGIDPSYTVMQDFDVAGRVVVEKVLTSFGKIEHRKAAALIKIEADRQNVKALENEISFQVKQVFYNILMAREALKVAHEFAELTHEYEDLAQKHFKAGVVSRFDVLRAGVSSAEARKNIISAGRALELSKAYLLLLVSQKKDVSFDIKSPPPVFLKEEITLEGLQKSALANRSEIKEIDTYILVSGKMLDAARSNNKPDLLASGEFGADVNPMLKGILDNYTWNVGISFRIPLFDGGETKAKVAEAESGIRELKINREALGDHIRLQVKQAWLDYREAKATVEVVNAELLKSKESYRLARARYKEGVSIAVEMDEALAGYNNSKKNLINAMHSLNLAYASLERAVGSGISGSHTIVLSPQGEECVKLEAKKNDEQ